MNDIKEENYQRIENLVEQFQNGDKDAARELLTAFDPYFKKYIKLIKEGFVNLSDKDTRKFIRLFTSDQEARVKLLKAKHSSRTRNKAFSAGNIVSNLCRDIPLDDIRQELNAILLTLAKRYKKKGTKTNFCGYLYNVFRYELFRRINEITSDPLVYNSSSNLSYSDESYQNDIEYIENEPEIYTNHLVMQIDDQLGNSWVRGLTCSEPFDLLTHFQRIIVKLSYGDGYSDTYISKRLGLHRNTVRKYRLEAIEILQESMGDACVNIKKEN